MVAKLAVIIIAIGAAFGALLVNRQQRIDAVAEISRSQLRMELHDKTIMRLQAAVAQAIRPDELRVAAFSMPVEWQQIPYRFDPFRSPTSGETAVAGLITAPGAAGSGPERPMIRSAQSGQSAQSAKSNRGKPKSASTNGSRGAMPEKKRTPQRVAEGTERGGNR